MIIKIIDHFINAVVGIFFIMVLSYGVYSFWDQASIVNAAGSQNYTAYKPIKKENQSFLELQKENKEVIGWLSVYGTEIDYPFAQGEDNTKYINTDIKGKSSISGSLFLDSACASDFSEFIQVIYGHHMSKHAMFGDLDEFSTPEFFDSHKYGNLYLNGSNYGLEFFAFLKVDAYDTSVYGMNQGDENGKESYIENLKNKSSHYRNLLISPEDHLVLLSTCTSDNTNGRHVLVGRLTKKTYKNQFKDGAIKETKDKYKIEQLSKTSLIVAVLSIVLIIMIVLLLVFLKKRKRYIVKKRKEYEKK